MPIEDTCELLAVDVARADELRRQRPPLEVVEQAAEAAKGLSDPTRLGIALALRDEPELCICDLAWITERPQNLVSHHARALRAAGLVHSRRDGKMVMYALTNRGRALVDVLLAEQMEVTA